jgi:nitrite reductase (NO-forming)
MPSAESRTTSPSLATTIAITLAIAALALGSVHFVAVVQDDNAPAAPSAATGATTTASTSRIDFNEKWNDAFVARDPKLAPAPNQRVHNVTMTATEKELEIAPGVKQIMWTFNDQVPGPTLRGKVGDIFRIKVVNGGSLPHSIDFHASKVAWNDEMRTIGPGESLVYEY